VALYCDISEADVFARMGDLLVRNGCEPLGLVETVPWDREFEYVSDLAEVIDSAHLDRARFRRVVAGDDPARRPVRAGYTQRSTGTTVLEYLGAAPGDRHPVAVSVSAGALGIPPQLWSRADRAAARKLADRTRDLLAEAALECQAGYGGIGVELSLASPARLGKDRRGLSTELFVGSPVLTRHPWLDRELRDAYGGGVSEWAAGLFCAGWAPYRPDGTTIENPGEVVQRCGTLLRRAVLT